MKLIRNLIVILGAIAMCACNVTEPVGLTLVQYNVGAFHKYDSSSVDSIVWAVKEMGADVVSLNEVDSCTTRTGSVDQLAVFSAGMGDWNSFYARAIPYKGGAYGVGVVSAPSFDIVRTDRVALPKFDGKEPRTVAVVEYEDFVFASTHLDLTLDSQLGQITALNHYMDSVYADYCKPVFLAGDFNCEPGSEPINLMMRSWILLSPERFSYPSPDPIKCIDYIFVRPNGGKVEVKSTEIISDLETVDLSKASDHLPIAVKLTIK